MAQQQQPNFCSHCGQSMTKEGRTDAEARLFVLKAMAVMSKLIKEFDNPDNHAHQRGAIEEAKDWMKTV